MDRVGKWIGDGHTPRDQVGKGVEVRNSSQHPVELGIRAREQNAVTRYGKRKRQQICVTYGMVGKSAAVSDRSRSTRLLVWGGGKR